MKELLYIPSGRYVKFFPVPCKNEKSPSISIEEYIEQYTKYYSTTKKRSIQDAINEIRKYSYSPPLYRYADIPYDSNNLTEELPVEFFELIEED